MFEGAADVLRIGTNMFGFWKSDLQRQRCAKIAAGRDLEPVLTWKTRILSLKTIPAGRPVGYNRTFVAPRSLTLATVPVGYVDGYPRALSNRAHVLIRGVLAPVVGLVSMNMLTIDVSEVPDIALGDEVVLLGSDKGVTAPELAQAMGSVPNELTTRINPLIPRLVVL